jgi:hypothetical protein
MSETLTAPTFQEIQESVARGEESKWNIGPDGEMLSEGFTMDSTGAVVWVGEGPEPDDTTTPGAASTPDPLQKIFDYISSEKRKWYSKSYDEFKEQYSTEEAQDKLFNFLKKKKAYSKSKGDFLNKYFPIQDEETEVKEEPTVTTEEGAASTEVDDSLVTPKTYHIKPKNAEEVQQSLFTLKDGIDGTNEIVTNRTVEKYFEEPMKGFNSWMQKKGYTETEKVYNFATKDYSFKQTQPTEQEREEYLKEYLGEQKYNEYITWDNGDGELPTDNEEFNTILNQEINERQKERQQEYLRTVPEELRKDALVMMPDIFGGYSNLGVEAGREDDASEFEELYGRPLVRKEYMKGRNGKYKQFIPAQDKSGFNLTTQKYDNVLEQQGKYIESTYNTYKSDAKAYENSVTAWNKENKNFETELKKIESDFKKLGDVDKDSSQQSIDAHNALVGDYKDLVQRMKDSGLDDKSTELMNLQKSLGSRYDDLMDKSEKFEDISMASAALGLNYDFGERLALQLESAFLGDIGVLASGAMSALAEVSRILPGDQQDMEFYKHINDNYKASINYNESVKNKIQTSLPKAITWETRKGNIGAYAADMLANNSPSILTAIGSGGFGALATRGMGKVAAMQMRKKLMKGPMAIFFSLEGGAKLADMETSKKNAPKAIAFFDQELSRTDLSPAERQELLSLRSEQENALNINQFQKAFSTIGYGAIAMYAERFGTLSYVNGLNRWGTTAGMSLAKKTLYGSANSIFNVGIELLEETGTQFGHNLIDITVLDQDKSMIEGIDTEFLVNVAFSSLAIQGPSMGMNSYNAIKGEVKSRQDINRDNKLAAELNEIQNILSEGIGINAKDRKTLVARKREILKEAALNDVISLQRASRMTPQEVEQLFEINRENRKDIKILRELGRSGEEIDAIKKRKDEIADRINKRNEKRETLLSRDSQRRRAKLKEYGYGKDRALEMGKKGDIKEVGTGEYFDSDSEFWLARHEYNEDITRGLGNSVFNFKGENARELFIKYLDGKDLMEEEKAEILEGFDQGAYGTNIGSDAILFENNIMRGIAAGGFAAKMASATALHEALHIQNKKAGIVKDDNIVEAARTAVDEIRNRINELAELGEISKKDKADIDKRIASYDGMTGVMLEELINLAGDLKTAGIMGRESLSLVHAFKSLLNRAISKFNGGNDMFFMFETVDDVLRYIDSFQGKLAKGDIALPPEEEEKAAAKPSLAVTPLEAINDLLPKDIKTNEDYNNLLGDPRRFKTIFEATLDNGVISNYVKSKSIGDEYNDAIESVRDRLINFKPEAERADGTIVGKKGFGEFIFANTRFGKLDAKKALAIKAEETKRTKSIDTKEARQIEDTSTQTTDKGPDTRRKKTNVLKIGKVERKANTIRKIVKVKPGDTFKEVSDNNTGKVAEEIFDVPAKKITDPKKNLTYAKKIKDGIPEPSEAGNIQTFYGDTQAAEKLIKILPTENVTSSDADINEVGENIDVDREVLGRGLGLTNRMLNYFYNKTNRRSKGKKSQPFIWELKPEFKNPTTSVVEQLQKDLGITPRGELNNYNRNIGQLLKGIAKFQAQQTALSTAQRILTEQKAPKKQIASVTAAQSKVAFSKGVENIVAIRSLFELEQKGIDKLLKTYGIDKTFNLRKEKGREDFVKAIEETLLPLMPRDFWFGPDSTVFTASNKTYGLSMSTTDGKRKNKNNRYKNPKEAKAYNNLRDKLKGLRKLDNSKFGKPIMLDGKEIDFKVSSYDTMFGDAKKIKSKIKNGDIEAWNKKVALIHREMWKRFNNAINQDGKINKDTAAAIGTYLKLVGSDTNHWHKLGAQFVGYSDKITGKRFEYEHAMPATAAYLYLMDAVLSDSNFNASYNAVIDNYKLIALDKAMDIKLTSVGLQRRMPEGWDLMRDKWYDRYFNDLVNNVGGGIDPSSIIGLGGKTFGEMFNIKKPIIKENLSKTKKLNKAIVQGRKTIKESKGITVLDFDDTLATTKSLVKFTRPDGTTGALNAEQYASTYENLLDQGYTFDFSEFNKVVKGKLAPLFNKAIKLQGKFGPENMFVLTARPPAAAKAIFDFLKANGLNIPMKNITGLGNSTAEAKALWIADKVGEGYNDFYFADDALQNVQAVKNMLDQFDVKSKVQQAKVKFSKSMDQNFNDILENVTGIESEKRFSAIKARKRGESKGKFRFFIPPSHEDFVGLLYNFMGKGKEGNAHRDFWEKSLIRPLNRAYRELNAAKQSIANDYKSLNKQFPDVKKKLTKKTPDGDFTYQDAIRVYLWNKHGHKIPGLTETDQQKLVDLVMQDSELQAYAETLNVISKQEAYVKPTESWEAGDLRTDLDDATGRIGREQFFTEFFENADIIFSQENLNKIEAAYGTDVVSAIKDMLYRTKTGRNRPSGQNKMVNQFLNYLNGSVASTMFFNIRSAVLQQMSMVNFINFADNNILSAAKAFANQKQYWTDWATIFNSDFMKQRRAGIKTDVNGAELAESVKNATNPIQAAIKKLLELGFLPTQIGDNIAIATGGATFYRNRINTYLKQGLSQKEAESKAWTDFQVLAEATQQSARPDMVSQQQASPLGKIILAFQNVTSQFNRLGKKAFLDIKNRRITPGNTTQLQSDMSNLSRIAYYFAIQNLIFYSLQSALFMAMFDDDEEDERWLKKKERIVNGSIDSVLRGTGVWGSAIATLKNMAIKWHEQRDKGWNKDESAVLMEMLNVSPPLGIKARKLVNAEKTLNYNKNVISEMETFDIDNPQWSAVTNYVEATTNVPLNRLYNKTQNVRESLDNQHNALERILMFSGWSKWNLGIGDSEKIKEVKETIKEKKKEATKIKQQEKKNLKLKEKELEGKEKQKKEKKEGKKVTCLVCKLPIVKGKKYCTIHEKKEQTKGGKKKQCRKYKKDGGRCNMQTSNKSGFCYYHD